MTIPLKYSRRSVTSRPIATFSAAGSVALVVFVLAASLMLAGGLRDSMLKAGSADRAIVMQQGGYAEVGSRVRQATLGLVASVPGVQSTRPGEPSVSGELVDLLMLERIDRPGQFASVQIRGVTSSAFAIRPEVRILAGRMPRQGVGEAIVGKQVAGRYGEVRLDGSIQLEKGVPVRVVGVFSADGSALESEIWVDLHVLQTATSSDGYLSSITARLSSPSAYPAFESVMTREHFAAGVGAESERSYYEKISMGLTALIRGLGGIIAGVFSIGAILAAAITMYGTVAERTKEIGVLRALGFEKRDVLAAFLFESAALSGLGVGLGSAMALLVTFADFTTMNEATGAEIAIRFAPSVGLLTIAALAGIGVGVIGGVFPAVRAARIDPIRAMKD